MNLGILLPSLVWMTTFFTIAGIFYFSTPKQETILALPSRKQRFALGLIAIGAAAIPAAIEADFSNGSLGFAGIPLAVVGLCLIFWKQRRENNERQYTHSYREKSIAISLALTVILYGIGSAIALASGGLYAGIAWLAASTFLMILSMGFSHAILVVTHQPELEDERDRMITLRSSKNGYATLCIGIWCCLLTLFYTPSIPAIGVTIFAVFVLAEIVRMTSALIYFRFDI